MSGDCSDGMVSTLRFLRVFCSCAIVGHLCELAAAVQPVVGLKSAGSSEEGSGDRKHPRGVEERRQNSAAVHHSRPPVRERNEINEDDSDRNAEIADRHRLHEALQLTEGPPRETEAFVYQCLSIFQTWSTQMKVSLFYNMIIFLFQFSKSANKPVLFSENE